MDGATKHGNIYDGRHGSSFNPLRSAQNKIGNIRFFSFKANDLKTVHLFFRGRVRQQPISKHCRERITTNVSIIAIPHGTLRNTTFKACSHALLSPEGTTNLAQNVFLASFCEVGPPTVFDPKEHNETARKATPSCRYSTPARDELLSTSCDRALGPG